MPVIPHGDRVHATITVEEMRPVMNALDDMFEARAYTGYEAALVMTILIEEFCARAGVDNAEFWELVKAGEGRLKTMRKN